ncbi:LuxR C-terminal-related transcriptional regulator [Salibacterium qingdaonense]|uniref:Regulatory protein, luxR family n=1 Tax=Salibacterium qingdaonense TaxID=266892 RepID=A0A1I4QM98_9BACI|nr:LuxR C-terminal-related transcriptional regulator [Salibacterium qingdaonense]SFM41171.1 regulatory protein, luxR family [Salibacterium qingdaonense]
MKEFYTLKDYVVEYQAGNKDVLKELIGHDIKEEYRTEIEGKDHMKYFKFKDKKLQNIYWEIIKNYKNQVDRKDIDDHFQYHLVELFEKVDTTKTPQQLISYFAESLYWRLYDDKINYHNFDEESEQLFNSEDDYTGQENSENEKSRFDKYTYTYWMQAEDTGSYQDFLKHIGGIQNILTEKRFQLYSLLQHGYNQKEIAEKLSVKEGTVSEHVSKIEDKIKEEYLAFRSVKSLHNEGTYQTIHTFISYYDHLQKAAGKDFDYFDYIMEFLKKHLYDYNTYTTVLDVLYNHMKGYQVQMLIDYIQGKESKITSEREEQRMLDRIIKAFRKYIDECEKNIHKYWHHAVKNTEKNEENESIKEEKEDKVEKRIKEFHDLGYGRVKNIKINQPNKTNSDNKYKVKSPYKYDAENGKLNLRIN